MIRHDVSGHARCFWLCYARVAHDGARGALAISFVLLQTREFHVVVVRKSAVVSQ